MDHARRLAEARTDPDRGCCPSCAVPCGSLPPQAIHEFDERELVRCLHCGERHPVASPIDPLRDCRQCGAPRLLDSGEAERCATCGTRSDLGEQELAAMGAAIEGEWLAGLSREWEFVASDPARRYLERMRRTIVGVVEGLPAEGQLLIVREPRLRSLAMPAGSVCLSTGLLGSLADEAEMVFVLAHELAHSASGECRRQSLRALASSGDAVARRRRWLACSEDLMRLGYGDKLEFEADRLALRVVQRLGYDGVAPLRWLRRIGRRQETDPQLLGELALAHPTVPDRVGRIDSERNLQNTGDGPGTVCNREIFRRLLGHTALESELQPARPTAPRRGASAGAASWARRARYGLLIVAAGALMWLLTRMAFGLG